MSISRMNWQPQCNEKMVIQFVNMDKLRTLQITNHFPASDFDLGIRHAIFSFKTKKLLLVSDIKKYKQ